MLNPNNLTSFHEAYYLASEEDKDVIDSEMIGSFVTDKMPITDSPSKTFFIILISCRFLEVIDDESLRQSLIERSTPGIDIVLEKISTFINDLKTAKAGSDPDVTEVDIKSEITEVEENLQKLNPIRTMGSDSRQVGYNSNEETTYTSTQSALMNESK